MRAYISEETEIPTLVTLLSHTEGSYFPTYGIIFIYVVLIPTETTLQYYFLNVRFMLDVNLNL